MAKLLGAGEQNPKVGATPTQCIKKLSIMEKVIGNFLPPTLTPKYDKKGKKPTAPKRAGGAHWWEVGSVPNRETVLMF
jgi:hypothetical protein